MLRAKLREFSNMQMLKEKKTGSRELVQSEFNWDKISSNVLNIYRDLVFHKTGKIVSTNITSN